MAAVLVSTLRSFDGLAEVVEAAAQAHEADAVAGTVYFGRTAFGVVAVNAEGQATLADTLGGKVISW